MTPVDVPAEIDPTGEADVTDALNAFFASVPPDSTVVFPTAAVYRAENSLFATWERVLVEGNGATIYASTDGSQLPPHDGKLPTWPRQRHHLALKGCRDVTVRDLAVRGPNTEARYQSTHEGQHGLLVNGGSNVLLVRVSVDDVWGDFVCVAQAASRVTCRNGVFSGAGRQGFGVSSGTDLLFEDWFMTRVARTAIDVEPVSHYGEAGSPFHEEVTRATFRRGMVKAPVANAIVGNLGTGPVHDLIVSDVSVEGRSLSVLSDTDIVGQRSRCLIERVASNFATNHPPVITFGNFQHVTVAHVTQPFRGKGMTGAAVRFKAGACGQLIDCSFPATDMAGNPVNLPVSTGVGPCDPSEPVTAAAATGAGAA